MAGSTELLEQVSETVEVIIRVRGPRSTAGSTGAIAACRRGRGRRHELLRHLTARSFLRGTGTGVAINAVRAGVVVVMVVAVGVIVEEADGFAEAAHLGDGDALEVAEEVEDGGALLAGGGVAAEDEGDLGVDLGGVDVGEGEEDIARRRGERRVLPHRRRYQRRELLLQLDEVRLVDRRDARLDHVRRDELAHHGRRRRRDRVVVRGRSGAGLAVVVAGPTGRLALLRDCEIRHDRPEDPQHDATTARVPHPYHMCAEHQQGLDDGGLHEAEPS